MNVYEIVTDRIIKKLEEGTIPWRKQWMNVSAGAFNRVSRKPYSLLNQMLLSHEGEYASFRQWSALGGHVKKISGSLRTLPTIIPSYSTRPLTAPGTIKGLHGLTKVHPLRLLARRITLKRNLSPNWGAPPS